MHGAIYRFEGQMTMFDAAHGSACYRCLFSEPPPLGSVASCAEAGVFGVLPGIVGSLMAFETIKHILDIGEPLTGRLLLFEGLDMNFREVRLRKNPRALLAPCTSQGRPLGAPVLVTGRVLEAREAHAAENALAGRYGIFRAVFERTMDMMRVDMCHLALSPEHSAEPIQGDRAAEAEAHRIQTVGSAAPDLHRRADRLIEK